MAVTFDLNRSFEENLAAFEVDANTIDPDCAKVLFDNLHLLETVDGEAPSRQAVREFNQSVLEALEAMLAGPDNAEA